MDNDKDSDKAQLQDKDSVGDLYQNTKKLTQSTLAFQQLSAPEDTLIAGVKFKLSTDSVSIQPKTPSWVVRLLSHFEVIGFQRAEKSTKYTLKCLVCERDKLKATNLTDKGATSFVRHLKTLHKKEFDLYEGQQHLSNTANSANVTNENQLLIGSTKISLYPRNHPIQKRFEKDLLNYVIMDTVPFSVTEGSGFQNLIRGFDGKVIFPHPTTVERWVNVEYFKITSKVRDQLMSAQKGSLHFIIDIWTSQQGKSIIGFKCQFIKDWAIKNLVVGFKHFPEAHTSENVRDMLESFLGTELKLLPEQIGSITADNAANILGAFKVKPVPSISSDTIPEQAEEEQTYIVGAEDDLYFEQRLLATKEEIMPDHNDTDTDIMITALQRWTNVTLPRNGCLTHLLHLTVKDSVKRSNFVTSLAKKLTETVSFFHNSPKWTAVLRKKTSGLSLVKPMPTRWSSLYNAIRRITRKDKVEFSQKVDMAACVNSTLIEAKAALPKKSKVPAAFTDEELDSMKMILQLLEPCALLTDELQGDGVTSSLVILGFINAILAVEGVEIEEELDSFQNLVDFRSALIDNLMDRFSSRSNTISHQKRGRRIVKVDVFNNKNYILAALLDSRIKLTCFDEKLVSGTVLENFVPKISEAEQILQTVFDEHHADPGFQLISSNESEAPAMEPPRKKPRTMFSLVSNVMKDRHMNPSNKSEVKDYLNIQAETSEHAEKLSPLQFWMRSESTFPVLAKLALIYLGMPASSGSIERLFSVAAALGKARNARLLPETTERLLCCKSYKINFN